MLRYLLPTALGLFRLASVLFVVVWILDGRFQTAFWLFLAAGFSDAIDGVIARRLNAVSRFGTVLDPIADKLLMTLTLVALAAAGHAPWWLPTILFARDAATTIGYLIALVKQIDLVRKPLAIGKISTGVTIATTVTLLAKPAFGWDLPGLVLGMSVLTVILNLATWLLYTRIGLAALADARRGHPTIP
jgi:cardiolipin synthase